MALVKNRLSWWEYHHLIHDIDYTILGAGIVGISTAIELKEKNPTAKILILDKQTMPIGASTKNAGFACFGSVSEIQDDIQQYGIATAQKLIKMRLRGLSLLRQRVQNSMMDYLPNEGAEIALEPSDIDMYVDQISLTNDLVENATNLKSAFRHTSGPYGTQINNQYEGSLNPQKMMATIELHARKLGVVFLSGIDVQKIDTANKLLNSDKGDLPYQRLIICTNGFSQKLTPFLPIDENAISPARNQVLITEPIKGFTLDPCYHLDKGYIYFREIQNRLLIGGGRNIDPITEATDTLTQTDKITEYLRSIIQSKILPNKAIKIAHQWSGILGVGPSKMPLVKQLTNDAYAAVRMGGMGVAVGSYIGRLMASLILEDDNEDVRLYDE